MQKTLYDLPKDVLVMLISEIREKTERNCDDKYKNIIQKCIGCEYRNCFEEGCNFFCVINYTNDIVFGNGNRKILLCRRCNDAYCETHEKIFKCENCEWIMCKKHDKEPKIEHVCPICKKSLGFICDDCNILPICKICS